MIRRMLWGSVALAGLLSLAVPRAAVASESVGSRTEQETMVDGSGNVVSGPSGEPSDSVPAIPGLPDATPGSAIDNIPFNYTFDFDLTLLSRIFFTNNGSMIPVIHSARSAIAVLPTDR